MDAKREIKTGYLISVYSRLLAVPFSSLFFSSTPESVSIGGSSFSESRMPAVNPAWKNDVLVEPFYVFICVNYRFIFYDFFQSTRIKLTSAVYK